MKRKNSHAVALGRLGGRATKGISTPAKKEAAAKGARARWAMPIPAEIRPYFWREQSSEGRMTPMEMVRILYTRAPHLITKAVDRRTAMRFAHIAPTALERSARLALVRSLYG